ncbi:MAG: D-glycero-beta-D-manno-heptose 1-phosphate adenylyltransferase, partial [Magnetococcales bacterium]|nr:D-glycero-beta-D-manno-heptose 1-phosphate adenylyltransferase [Magnetococcales bacterium]
YLNDGENPPGAVILSDYGKGTLSTALCQTIIALAEQREIPVLVDPKGIAWQKYRGATCICPNRLELAAATRHPQEDLNTLLAAGETLRENLGVDFLAVTLSELGLALVQGDGLPRRIPAVAQEVFDVSGAGDTVIATLGAALAGDVPRMDALHLANIAAGVVVGKVGTTPINLPELIASVASEEQRGQSEKIAALEEAARLTARWREQGERVVFTNGCFDLLHAGHVTYLEKARRLGLRLVVGLNTDRSVQTLKGPTRPIIHQEDRARVLAAMASVDLVVLFDDETPLKLINALRPDVLAKGADYTENQVVGAKEVRSWGGEVALVPLVAGRSSSAIVENIHTQREQTR